MLQILVAPISKPVEEMSEEELNVCLTCFYKSARKKKGTVLQNFIEEPPLIASFRRRRTTNPTVTKLFNCSKTEG